MELSAGNWQVKKLGQKIPFEFEAEKDALVGRASCGAWFNGEYYIISGAKDRERAIMSKIDGCSLKRIGYLGPFESSRNLRCIGIPSSTKSSDKIMLIGVNGGDRFQVKASMYVPNQ